MSVGAWTGCAILEDAVRLWLEGSAQWVVWSEGRSALVWGFRSYAVVDYVRGRLDDLR